MSNLLVIDNFDSFTFNLVDALATAGASVTVRRNSIALADGLRLVEELSGEGVGVVLSPGPGHPADAGVCIDLIRALPVHVPLLGVCLGHQAIVEAFGGHVTHAKSVVHGKASLMRHGADGLFSGLPSPMRVARYHSLAATDLGAELRATALLEDGTCMAVQHIARPIYGLQFHPESILTPAGGQLLDTFLELAQRGLR